MRTTITINDDLVEKAEHLTGISERATLLRYGLQTLIEVESARRLARLGGSDPSADPAPRHRSTAS